MALVTARQAQEQSEAVEQGMSMAGMSVGDFVEEVQNAEQKLLDEQEAEREANDHARNLKFCYGRVDQLLESLGETHPLLIVQEEGAPPPEAVELPPHGPGAELLQLLREADERKQLVVDRLLAQLDSSTASCQQMQHALTASLALSREQLADLEKGMADDIYELAELIDDLDEEEEPGALAASERSELLSRAQARQAALAARAERHRQAYLEQEAKVRAHEEKEAKRYQPAFDLDLDKEEANRRQAAVAKQEAAMRQAAVERLAAEVRRNAERTQQQLVASCLREADEQITELKQQARAAVAQAQGAAGDSAGILKEERLRKERDAVQERPRTRAAASTRTCTLHAHCMHAACTLHAHAHCAHCTLCTLHTAHCAHCTQARMEEAVQRANELQSELQDVKAGVVEEVASRCAARTAELEAAQAAAEAEAEAARAEAAAARQEAGAGLEEELVQLRESLQAQTTATMEAEEAREHAAEQAKEGATELEALRPRVTSAENEVGHRIAHRIAHRIVQHTARFSGRCTP